MDVEEVQTIETPKPDDSESQDTIIEVLIIHLTKPEKRISGPIKMQVCLDSDSIYFNVLLCCIKYDWLLSSLFVFIIIIIISGVGGCSITVQPWYGYPVCGI